MKVEQCPCSCPCHDQKGVVHIVACCPLSGQPRPAQCPPPSRNGIAVTWPASQEGKPAPATAVSQPGKPVPTAVASAPRVSWLWIAAAALGGYLWGKR